MYQIKLIFLSLVLNCNISVNVDMKIKTVQFKIVSVCLAK